MMGEEFKVQYAIYKPSHVERIFMIGSPFANRFRNGVVLKDDGYLKGLLTNKEFPLRPIREYYLLNKCIELLRQDRWGVTVEEYRLLKPFAVKLFRECLRIVDLRNNRDMLKELRDSARAARLISRKRVEERVNAE